MDANGIRINDSVGNILSVTLSDILSEISEGNKYNWAILFLDGITNENQEVTLFDLQEAIKNSQNCLMINWNELLKLSPVFFQMYEATILGCLDTRNLKKYKTDREMFESCDIVLNLIDCVWWEVFSKDSNLINRLKCKFKETEPLEITDPDFS